MIMTEANVCTPTMLRISEEILDNIGMTPFNVLIGPKAKFSAMKRAAALNKWNVINAMDGKN